MIIKEKVPIQTCFTQTMIRMRSKIKSMLSPCSLISHQNSPPTIHLSTSKRSTIYSPKARISTSAPSLLVQTQVSPRPATIHKTRKTKIKWKAPSSRNILNLVKDTDRCLIIWIKADAMINSSTICRSSMMHKWRWISWFRRRAEEALGIRGESRFWLIYLRTGALILNVHRHWRVWWAP